MLQYPNNVKGRWHEIFGNENPLVLELACGKGEYTTGRATKEKNKNFLGVDIKGNRIYIGAKKALDEEIDNAKFLRINIHQITEYFAPDEVSEIWIIFPDPYLKDKRAKNRLTHPLFLGKYQKLLAPQGHIHLKTDSRELYEFTKEVLEEHNAQIIDDVHDIYTEGEAPYPLDIKTFYEKSHLEDGRTISHLEFVLPEQQITYQKKKKNEQTRISG